MDKILSVKGKPTTRAPRARDTILSRGFLARAVESGTLATGAGSLGSADTLAVGPAATGCRNSHGVELVVGRKLVGFMVKYLAKE